MAETDKIELGGNIELVGFKELDHASMVVLKKIVGTYAKKFSEANSDFEKLVVTKTDNGIKAELYHGGNVKNSESSLNGSTS